MRNKIIRSTQKISRSFKRWKLKKKWRFWRAFKFYFLRRKQKFFFFKLKWLFNRKRIIWHQLSVMYGKNIKNFAYNNHKSRMLFNSRFGSILCKLELRLNILLIRTFFVSKILQANLMISKKKIVVNSVFKHKKYIVLTGDLIQHLDQFNLISKINKRRKYNRYLWRRWKRNLKRKPKFNQTFFSIKKNYVLNFIEVNYCFFCFIVLRRPLFGEISHRNKKQLIISSLFRKIYFVY